MAKRVIHIVIGLLMANALLVCVVHYFGFRSLWLDEAFVADALLNQPLSSLFQELKSNQQFPRLYLSLIWIMQAVLGYELWVLRLLPFVFGFAALIFWGRLFRNQFMKSGLSPFVPFVAFALLLFNHHFFNFAPDLKQYTADVFFSAYGLWFGEKFIRKEWTVKNTFLWAWPILFSFTYVLVLGAYAVAVVLESGLSKRVFIALVIIAGFVGVAYAIDLRHTQARLYTYWGGSMGLREGTLQVLGGFWSRKAKWPFSLLAVMGAVVTVRRLIRKDMTTLVPLTGVLLFVFLLLLAALKQYPLVANRLTLFFYPFAVILISVGVASLIQARPKAIRLIGFAAVLGVSAVVFVKSGPELIRRFYFDDHWENINPALRTLDKDEASLVVYGSGTKYQVKVIPHRPAGFTFSHAETVMEDIKNKRYDAFYFLEATPNGDQERFAGQIQDYYKGRKVRKHLYLFESTTLE